MMLTCEKCGLVFAEAKIDTEAGGYSGEHWAVCPRCGSDELAEVEQCKLCKEWKLPEEMQSRHCCKECSDENLTVQTALDYLRETNQEKEFFVEWMYRSEVDQASPELINLCKSAWRKFGVSGQSELMEFMEEQKDDFADWLECM